MITGKEILTLILVIIVLAFSNSFLDINIFIFSLIFFTLIILFYIFGKKFSSSYLETKSEEKIWSFQRYGFKPHEKLKKRIPIGIILPLLLTIFSFGYFKWFATTQTDSTPTPARATRKHDFYSYSELTEWHIACISAAGIISVLVLSFLAYLLNFIDLAKLSIYFAAFNLIPLGNLDGTKIFFGSRIFYFTIVAIVLIALGYSFMII